MSRAWSLAALAALLLSGCGMYGSLYLEEEAPAEPPATAPVEPPPLPIDEGDEEDPEVTPRRADQAAAKPPKPPTRHP